jgi:hypothetical protein
LLDCSEKADDNKKERKYNALHDEIIIEIQAVQTDVKIIINQFFPNQQFDCPKYTGI